MDDSAKLARLIPALRDTFDALPKTPPHDPVARYTRALLAQILKTLENRGDDIAPRRPN